MHQVICCLATFWLFYMAKEYLIAIIMPHLIILYLTKAKQSALNPKTKEKSQ